MDQIKVRQFANPGVLTEDSTVFGIKAKVWHQAFTANFDKELAEVKRRVDMLAQEEIKAIKAIEAKKTAEIVG